MSTSKSLTKPVEKRQAPPLSKENGTAQTQKRLLFCGVLSSLWYIALNIFVPLRYPGYNAASQVVSELSAIGAPTRPLWLFLCAFYTVLVIAFGLGVWQTAANNRNLRMAGALLLLNAFIGLFWPPMHSREALAAGGATLTDTWHIVFTALTVPLMMLVIGLGAATFGKAFRLYSIATLAVLIAAGLLTGLEAPKLSTGEPTPWIGVWERINIGVYMVWVMVFATRLLHRRAKRAALTEKPAA